MSSLKTILRILQHVFSMFVLEALILTFMTTPLVTYFYLPHLRRRIAASGSNFDNIADEAGTASNLVAHYKMTNSKRVSQLSSINCNTCLARWRSHNSSNRHLYRFPRTKAEAPLGMNHGRRLRKASTIFLVSAWGCLGSPNFRIVFPML
jgi:hypothetical protein